MGPRNLTFALGAGAGARNRPEKGDPPTDGNANAACGIHGFIQVLEIGRPEVSVSGEWGRELLSPGPTAPPDLGGWITAQSGQQCRW